MNKIAILTVTRDSSHIWYQFISSFARHCDRKTYDLFVWDNNSREGDKEYLKTYLDDGTVNHIFFNKSNDLFTAPINRLIDLAYENEYEQVMIANPDIKFIEGWDRDVSENKGIMGFVLVKPNGVIEHAGAYGGGEHIGRGEIDSPDIYQEMKEVDWVTFGAVLIHRNVIERVGYLDEENYPHFGSDREYCRKCRDSGITISCSPARLIHSYGYSTRPYIFRDVPEKIWRTLVNERRSAGVYLPEGQNFRG